MLTRYFMELNKFILKRLWENKHASMARKTWKKKNYKSGN